MHHNKRLWQKLLLNAFVIMMFLPFYAKAGDSLRQTNRAPTINDIADQSLCYTKDQQTILLKGISAGAETWQRVTVTVNSNNNPLFDRLEANKLANGNGYVKYHIAKGRYGSAVVTVLVKDDGGTAGGGVNSISKTFTITVNPLPVLTTGYTLVNNVALNAKYDGKENTAEKVRLSASSAGAAHYYWYPEQGLDNAQAATPEYAVTGNDEKTFFVTATSMYGCKTVDSVVVKPGDASHAYKLSVFPNPTSKNASVQFMVPHDELYVAVNVYAASGNKVGTIYQGKAKGKMLYNIKFNGDKYSSGVYFLKLSTITHEEGYKFLITK